MLGRHGALAGDERLVDASLDAEFCVAALFRVPSSDTGRLKMELVCRNGSGEVMHTIEEHLHIKDRQGDNLLHLTSVPSARLHYGKYVFSLLLNGREIATAPLYVCPARASRRGW